MMLLPFVILAREITPSIGDTMSVNSKSSSADVSCACNAASCASRWRNTEVRDSACSVEIALRSVKRSARLASLFACSSAACALLTWAFKLATTAANGRSSSLNNTSPF